MRNRINAAAASIQETRQAIDQACWGTGYSCKSVSWDDVQRGTVGGSLSCWGGNITDTRLYEKSGTLLYTVRSDNWNEKLGKVRAQDIAVVVGNHEPPPGKEPVALKPITLQDFLKNVGMYASYNGVNSDTTLWDEKLDKEVSIRFQTTFLPVDESEAVEFCTEAYNYNTRSDDDPRNAVVLCTTQGIAYQQDGAGSKRLFHHAVDASSEMHLHWLEAERSEHKVGGAQVETKQEAAEAASRGKATASVIGIETMGTRFNALMTIQIPLQQTAKPKPIHEIFGLDPGAFAIDGLLLQPMRCGGLDEELGCAYIDEEDEEEVDDADEDFQGTANAARVSRGSEALGEVKGVINSKPKRDPSQHCTVTIVLYNTVMGGVPSTKDVMAAIEDMEALYQACGWKGRLSESGAGFMKNELTVSDANEISKKITTQPYVAPKCAPVENAGVFPTPQTS